MTEFLQLLLVGISQGCIYGLIALGFVIIYKATEMVNFAQGEFMMLGAFVAWSFVVFLDGNVWLGLVGAVIVMAVVGFLVDATVVRQIIGQPQFSVVILTIGMGIVFRSLAGMLWGNEPLTLAPLIGGTSQLGGVTIDNERLTIIAGAALLFAAVWAFFRFNRWGIAVQAASQNQLAAYYLGIPVRLIYSAVWAGAAMISTVAGVLLAPITLLEPLNGLLGIKAIAAAVIGGFSSMPGAVLGGIIIGLAEAFFGAYAPDFKEVSGYIIMLVVLTVRPRGLFGTTFRKKV